MEFAWPAVVEQAKGNIVVLLHLDKTHPAANGVDGAARDIECISRIDFVPVEQIDNATIQRGRLHVLSTDLFAKPGRNPRARFGMSDDPAFAFSSVAEAQCSCLLIRGVSLNRQSFAGKNVFRQELV